MAAANHLQSNMNPGFGAVLEKLNAEFTVVSEPFYLSQVFTPGGRKLLHNYLTSIAKPEFSPNERIVIIQDQDRYRYDDHPGDGLSLLQKYLFEIDIDSFFVVVVTGNKNIRYELEQLQKSVGQETPIKHVVVDGVEFDSTPIQSDTFCVLPWIHVYADTDGSMLPCCSADDRRAIGNLKEHSVVELFNNDKFKKIRKNMLNERRSPECFRCYESEENAEELTSYRQNQNALFSHLKDELIAATDPDGTLNDIKIRYLDIRLSNICNLKCRTCGGRLSSLLAQEEKLLFNDSKNLNRALNSKERKLILTDIIQFLPTVEKIYFAGGEPLIMSEHYEILDRLIDLGKTDVKIFYNTNFTSLSYKTTSVIDYWKQFSKIDIGASLDGHGQTVEYVRHGTNWNAIENNLQQVRTQVPHVKFTVTSTVSLLTVLSIIELQRMWHEQNKVDIGNFSIGFVNDSWLNLQVLPADFKEKVSTKILDHVQWLSGLPNTEKLIKQWLSQNNFMLADDLTHMLPEMYRFTKLRDNFRNESFETVFPEIYNSIKPYV